MSSSDSPKPIWTPKVKHKRIIEIELIMLFHAERQEKKHLGQSFSYFSIFLFDYHHKYPPSRAASNEEIYDPSPPSLPSSPQSIDSSLPSLPTHLHFDIRELSSTQSFIGIDPNLTPSGSRPISFLCRIFLSQSLWSKPYSNYVRQLYQSHVSTRV